MHILIVRNNSNPQARDASLLLAAYLNAQGIGYTAIEAAELTRANEARVWEKIAAEAGGTGGAGEAERAGADGEAGTTGGTALDMAVVLGGDGTILRTARLMRVFDAPILGINFGRLGFLANSSEDGVVAILAAALAGDVVYEHKTNLQIEVACVGDDLKTFPPIAHDTEGGKGAEATRSFFALNELSITRGAMGRIIDFDLVISGAHVAAMRGDGVVVATATGSTAYALSAGGPLVAPSFEGLIVVPLAPHTLHSRSIVTAACDVVEIDLSNNPATREATLFTDGEILELPALPVRICIRRGSKPTTLIRHKREGFYEHVAQVFF